MHDAVLALQRAAGNAAVVVVLNQSPHVQRQVRWAEVGQMSDEISRFERNNAGLVAILGRRYRGRQALRIMRQMSLVVRFRSGTGGDTDPDAKVVRIGRDQGLEKQAGFLVHEMTHAESIISGSGSPDDVCTLSRDEFVRKRLNEEVRAYIRGAEFEHEALLRMRTPELMERYVEARKSDRSSSGIYIAAFRNALLELKRRGERRVERYIADGRERAGEFYLSYLFGEGGRSMLGEGVPEAQKYGREWNRRRCPP